MTNTGILGTTKLFAWPERSADGGGGGRGVGGGGGGVKCGVLVKVNIVHACFTDRKIFS